MRNLVRIINYALIRLALAIENQRKIIGYKALLKKQRCYNAIARSLNDVTTCGGMTRS